MAIGRRLNVLGVGGHGAVVVATARAAGFEVVGLYDDDRSLIGTTVMGLPVLGDIADSVDSAVRLSVVAIGDNEARLAVARRTSTDLATIVHPRSMIADGVLIGLGSVVLAGVVIQPRAKIGAHVILNSGAIVDHDTVIGDATHIAPGATVCGGVTIGSGVLVGAGATIAPGAHVGDSAVVGAGAVVVGVVPPATTAVGVPARQVAPR